MPTVLIIEDESDLVDLLDFNLRQAGLETQIAHSGEAAYEQLTRSRPDPVLLDLMLPDVSGMEICRRMKAHPDLKNVPVVMLTAKGEEIDRVVGFELGVDDYISKPFSMRELVLRVKAILRRIEQAAPAAKEPERSRTAVGPIRIDPDAHRAYVADSEVTLTALEFRLLATLMARLGRVQTREQLLEDVWGVTSEIETRTVDTHVNRLREKLGPAREQLETVRGVGYRLIDPSEKK